MYHLSAKRQSQERLLSRKMERKMLTYQSNQPGLKPTEAEMMGDLHGNEATVKVADLMKQRRSETRALINLDNIRETKPSFWNV